jgi:multimeric flavodoxin WrbA
MNEIYPLWVAAHGIMIVTPVNWYQVSSPLKLMMDRLVCADGGNPDPTRTQGKNAELAKQIELAGWDYPRHLAGRVFSVVVHGDVEGAENVRRSISDWLCFMHLCSAGPTAELDRYIGYWKPYCHQPCRARCRHRHPGGSAQCRAHAARGGAQRARRHICQRRGKSAAAAAEIGDDLSLTLRAADVRVDSPSSWLEGKLPYRLDGLGGTAPSPELQLL